MPVWRGGPKKDSLTKEGEVAGEMWGEGWGGALIGGKEGGGGGLFSAELRPREAHTITHISGELGLSRWYGNEMQIWLIRGFRHPIALAS